MQTFQLTRKAIWYRRMDFSPDGRWLALSGKPFTLLDTTGGRPLDELPLGDFRWGFAFVRNGTAIAYLPSHDQLEEYDLTTRQVRKQKIEGGHVRSVVADASGERLYLSIQEGGYKAPSGIRVVDLARPTAWTTFGTVADDLFTLRLSADGRWIAATSYNCVRAWNVGGSKLPTRAAICAKPKHGVSGYDLSADGAHVAIVTSHGLEIWNTLAGERTAYSGKHKRSVTAVACSPTQPVLVTGDNAGNVFLWDYTGRVLTRFDWKLGEVFDLTFAPDGLRCAAVDDTGKVVVWDVDA